MMPKRHSMLAYIIPPDFATSAYRKHNYSQIKDTMNSKEMNLINWKEYIKRKNVSTIETPLPITAEASLRCSERRRLHMTKKIEEKFGKSLTEL